mgnify:CR=1 FL=1
MTFWEYLVYPPFRASCFGRLRLRGKATKSSESPQAHQISYLSHPPTPGTTRLFWSINHRLPSCRSPRRISHIRSVSCDHSTSTSWETPQQCPKKTLILICRRWVPWARSLSRLFPQRRNEKLKLPPPLLETQMQTRRNPNFFPLRRHDLKSYRNSVKFHCNHFPGEDTCPLFLVLTMKV